MKQALSSLLVHLGFPDDMKLFVVGGSTNGGSTLHGIVR